MDLSNILVIAGKPDLSELSSRTKSGAIVKNLVSGQKYPVFTNDRISSLAEIRIFTDDGETPLEEVLTSIHKLYNGQPTTFDPKKEASDKLFGELGKALPTYDHERVHASDVKKLFSWYNVLLNSGKFEESEKEESEKPQEMIADTQTKTSEKPRQSKSATPKAAAKPKSAPKRTTSAKKAI